MTARETQIVALTPTADHTGLEGRAVKNSSGSAALIAGATEIPIGVITEGQPTTRKDAVALMGFGGTVKVKLDATPGTVVAFSYLVTTATGTAKLDPGTGNRVRFAQALEAGAANELIEARLIEPASLS
jgi:hypothetical protein